MTAKQARDMFYSPDKEFSRAEDRALAREELIYNVTEDLIVLLEKLQVSKVTLARHLGKSRSYITQLLSGSRNMTLGSLADICFALGVTPEINFTRDHSNQCELTNNANWQDIPVRQPRLGVVKATPIFQNGDKTWHKSNEVAA